MSNGIYDTGQLEDALAGLRDSLSNCKSETRKQDTKVVLVKTNGLIAAYRDIEKQNRELNKKNNRVNNLLASAEVAQQDLQTDKDRLERRGNYLKRSVDDLERARGCMMDDYQTLSDEKDRLEKRVGQLNETIANLAGLLIEARKNG